MKSFWIVLCLSVMVWADAHIFVYHRFNDTRHPSTNTSLEELRKEFDYFKKHGYEVIPLERLVDALYNKEAIPDNWVVLTIDDNYKSFYEHGLALFKEYNYPFSLFVYVGATEKKYGDFMSWEQLRETTKYGSLEFHSLNHPHMHELSDDALTKDFEEGLALFEKRLGFKPRYFSYPFGEFSPRIKAIASSFGFKAILNQNMGAVASFSDPLDLDRSALVGKSDLAGFLNYKALESEWIEPLMLSNNNTLTSLHVKVKMTASKGGMYISGYGYEELTLSEGIFKTNLNKIAIKERTRIMISVGNKISTKLLVKDNYGTK
ncbi:polysaccharide deacetylase family protein [Sulfurospirillum barnesii]|uniref:Putative xylanase/chitin deacetylase n=1 Tax=Sulfurospirillum barnesii (strain ATCC 700032 / DSM 10660 / SES-3) TaxID=760154 RepID=I3Y0U1_SULBS|nr:polysaccharide deacetylase family protein [Sulfurospirillum barnesii]AFL69815.1 putative xylanase/chitin deacetylase [Sulfurospirillum barnesii SES-3]